MGILLGRGELYNDAHEAAMGELDGVSKEVEENLAEAVGIQKEFREVCRNLGREGDVFGAGAVLEGGEGGGDEMPDVAPLGGEDHFVGFEFGEV